MGWLAVSFGFGLSFGVVIFMFGYISAHLNPATCLALWVIGKIPFTHFLALSGAEFAGAFLGACLVFLHYLPHFNTLPEPPATNDDELLLRSRDALSPEALNIASYDTRQRERMADRGGAGLKTGLAQAIKDIKFYFAEVPAPPQEHNDLVEVALGESELKTGPGEVVNGLRRRSVQVCDVHRRLQDMSIEEFKEKLHLTAGLHRAASINLAELDTVTGASEARASADAAAASLTAGQGVSAGSAAKAAGQAAAAAGKLGGSSVGRGDSSQEAPSRWGSGQKNPIANAAKSFRTAYQAHVEKFGSKQQQLYDAAIVADQNAKLSIFATRPAIYTPVFNFLCELMSTTALVFGALMMYERREHISGEFRGLFQAMEGFFVGFFVFVCILGLGGPTGIAANPARDMGPRVAHALLPIAGKGRSEFFYSWVPFVAPFAGGAIAGGFYLAVQKMNHSAVL
ncbi:Glycerol uptake facilitator [Chlorella sorokiniana]|uniref:Glycerol uptake facilitator n=1 Tax=Chlorella sorokiniana TaxID=3076 RepID=A0A2P6TJ81_CHLSO|nr:Glycerol uptake facilitator [Chlorella sorokiniana]|eukprot:PRW39304.1 Glycerol uptake facilitator [Chlorella sorokiniana]